MTVTTELETDAATPHPDFAEMTATFARIGCLSFGGPAGQIALMHKVLIDEKKWISEARFLHALNYCMLLPGPEAQQLATYIGWLLHGTRGGIVAGLLFILPGLAVILGLSALYAAFQTVPLIASLFFGLKAAVLAVVIEAVIRVAKRALKNGALKALAAIAFIGLFALQIPFPAIVLGAGLIGLVGARLRPDLFAPATHGAKSTAAVDMRLEAGAVGDHGWGHAVRTLLVWGGLWAAPVVAAVLILGPESVLVTLGLFFSKMAVVTFGGAYAVLSYVADAAVTQFGWLKPGEMLDGLALAETTPGPLILVLTFVGFQAGFRDAALGGMTGGLIGALLTTWVTFAPCFLWIFLGAPHVERLRGNRLIGGALTAITAAVVGVILNLALWFGLHTLFREVGTLRLGPLTPAWPVWSSLDPLAAVLALVAVAALLRFRIGMIPTLALCGALGIAGRMLL